MVKSPSSPLHFESILLSRYNPKLYRELKLLNCAASGATAVWHLVGPVGGYCWNWCSEGIQVHHYCVTLSVKESSSASRICTCAKVCHNLGTDGAIWASTPHTPLCT